MNWYTDWRLPQPTTSFKTNREKTVEPVPETPSAAATFSMLVNPVMAEAIQRTRELRVSSDAEVFHQLRVAFRKLRAIYWAYGPLLDEQSAGQATAGFRHLAAVAGATRDWDIVDDLLKAARESGLSNERLAAAVQEKRAQAVLLSQSTIENADVETFLREVLQQSEAALQSNAHHAPIQTFAEKRVRQAERALRKRSQYAARLKTADEEDLHDVRKAGKKLRYLLEFFQPFIRGTHDRAIRNLASVQNKLGQFNDLAASEMLIRNTSFGDVPSGAVHEALLWIGQQKMRQRRSASRRVRAIIG
jgi:CHAD domain-containing protein